MEKEPGTAVSGCAESRALEVVSGNTAVRTAGVGRVVISDGRAHAGHLGRRAVVGMASAGTLCEYRQGTFSGCGCSLIAAGVASLQLVAA